MWDRNWRIDTWKNLQKKWDLIVIGGGITGAGIFNLAARRGYSVLLLEASDFSFGTSSRSSKLVHGGLRYLQNKQYNVVRESVRERERMIKEAPGLVHQLDFLFAGYSDFGMSHRMLAVGTTLYDLMVPKWDYRIIRKEWVREWEPILNTVGLTGAVHYYDACVDDSRLVLRVIHDGELFGGTALNYARVTGFVKNTKGRVVSVKVQDQTEMLEPDTQEIQAAVVVNATGPWSDEVRSTIQGAPRLRKLRGSHLVFSRDKLPIKQAVTMLHPLDHRALFAIPWEGVTMIGTTDLDQREMDTEPAISAKEVDYLIQAANHAFPANQVTTNDIISSFAGLRPVIDTGASSPSKESRAHEIWEEDGVVTISGGKLTIFRVMAADVLNFIAPHLPGNPHFDHRDPVFEHPSKLVRPPAIDLEDWSGLLGRHGHASLEVINAAPADQLKRIAPLSNLWAELVYSATSEAVVHLDDLLLRRVRLGLCLPHGGLDQIGKIRDLVQTHLAWSDQHWQDEVNRYKEIWQKYYFLP